MKRKHLLAIVLVVAVAGGAIAYRAARTHPSVLGISNTPDSRNELRRSSLSQLKDGITRYLADHNNKWPIAVPTTQTEICTGSVSACKTTKLVDLNFLVGSGYMATIPNDPVGGVGKYTSGYEMYRDKAGLVHLVAVRAESAVISLSF